MDDGRETGPTGERERPEAAERPSSGRGHLVVVCGLPGVGKTAVSARVADRLDGRLLRTDVIRKELYDDPAYTPEERRAVYDELFVRAADTVRDGTDAVLDATFSKRADRELAADVAESVGADVDVVRVVCDAEVVRERIAGREDDESDADVEVYEQYREAFEPITRPHERIDNSGTVEETHRQVDELF